MSKVTFPVINSSRTSTHNSKDYRKNLTTSFCKQEKQLQTHNDELHHALKDLQAHLHETIDLRDRQIQLKESIISELQHALVVQKKSIEQIRCDSTCLSPDQVHVTNKILCAEGDTIKLKWSRGKSGPQPFHEGAAAAYKNLYVAYFNAAGTYSVFLSSFVSGGRVVCFTPKSSEILD